MRRRKTVASLTIPDDPIPDDAVKKVAGKPKREVRLQVHEPVASLADLPKENAGAVIAENPQAFGYTALVPLQELLESAPLVVPTDLQRLAIRAVGQNQLNGSRRNPGQGVLDVRTDHLILGQRCVIGGDIPL